MGYDEATPFVALLRACAKKKDLCEGAKAHDVILKKGLLQQCSDSLVAMYAKCGDVEKAKALLDTHKSRDVFTWTTLIAAYAHEGQGQDALDCFERMQFEGISPDAVTFVCTLKACGSVRAVDKGEQVHLEVAKCGLLRDDIKIGNALVDMYAKCGSMAKARQVFEELPVRDVVSWNALIAGYSQLSIGEEALNCFDRMQEDGLSPDVVTFTCILKACGSLGAVDKGELVHNELNKQELLKNNVVLGSALMAMYAKCGALGSARQLLEELPSRNVISWSTLIAGYAQQGRGEEALNCFEQMQCEGLSPNVVTFACLLKACATIGAAEKGNRIHEAIAKQGLLENNTVLGNALVNMYAKFGNLSKAQQVFKCLPVQDVVSWSSLIAGYAKHGQGDKALECFEEMRCKGFRPNAVTLLCALKACGSMGALDRGEKIHDEIVKEGLLGTNSMLGNALVDMYVKCGDLVKAQRVLEELPVRNVVSWSALIAGYAQCGQGGCAFDCFERMQSEGLSATAVTLLCILKACGSIGATDKGEKIHDEIVKQGLLVNNTALGAAVVDMYIKCSALTKAQQALKELPVRDVVCWNTLIAGYIEQDRGEQALDCFEQMQDDGLAADAITFVYILKACGSTGAANKGDEIHDEIVRHGLLGDDTVLGTALVDMYAKCGAIRKAQRVLDELTRRDVVSWNALMAGYAQQGEGEEVLACLARMQGEGLAPDAATFSCLLGVCSLLSLPEAAYMNFMDMSTRFSVNPDLEHYSCMVDLLGRSGHLDKAVAMAQKVPSGWLEIWFALLGACHKWGDVKVGRWAFEHAVQADESDSAAYVLMANVYAAAAMQDHIGKSKS